MNRDSDDETRRRQREALRESAGAWKDQDHPELKDGAAVWVRRMRQEDEPRLADILRRSYADESNPPEWVTEILSRYPGDG